MAKIIGLTGGIGSGKTTVGRMFMALGVPVYIADDAGRKVLMLPEAVSALRKEFGASAFTDGLPDRKKIAQIVFSNPDKLARLNNIIHPLVKEDFALWLEEHRKSPFVIRESAILFESGSHTDCDRIITVTAPLEDRILRVMARDNTDRESILARINAQWSDAERAAKSHYVIDNVDMENTRKQAVAIYESLINSM
ncbi:dephospho-CoA kinase [Flavobacterium magnum]|uniref:Dephospho-CoA kinase n=1 Tax=Flavobacterium magnum TaxID=2162713 RepID=A0A2S0RE90_9FLAO|nr:dephospho-CoA kinase [Flavobacterium magnum]AWA30073.1 dephospho-CoA kinase [Flavobacterium magnum]